MDLDNETLTNCTNPTMNEEIILMKNAGTTSASRTAPVDIGLQLRMVCVSLGYGIKNFNAIAAICIDLPEKAHELCHVQLK